jgi:hypothetical protein
LHMISQVPGSQTSLRMLHTASGQQAQNGEPLWAAHE